MAGRRSGRPTGAPGTATVVRRWWTTELRFAEGTGQSRMSRWFPDRLLIDYTRTMLAPLARLPADASIGMVGLGGGSQAKFLHRHLPRARIEAFEIDPAVLALRDVFQIPPDDERLSVMAGDAAVLIRERRGAYDLLLVDGYDAKGIPAALSTQRFYDDARAALRPGGVLAANLYDTDHAAHVERLYRAFAADRVRVLEELRQSNRVAFGFAPAEEPAPPAGPRAADALSWWARRQLRREFARLADVAPP